MAKRAKPTGTLSTALEATRLLGKWMRIQPVDATH